MKYMSLYALLFLNLASFSYAATGASATEEDDDVGSVLMAFDPSTSDRDYRIGINTCNDDSSNTNSAAASAAASAATPDETSVVSSMDTNMALGFDEVRYNTRRVLQAEEIAHARAGNPTEKLSLCILVPRNCPAELVEKYSFPLYALGDESYEQFSERLCEARGKKAYVLVGAKSTGEKIKPLTAAKNDEGVALFKARYLKLIETLMEHRSVLVAIKPALHLTYEK